ncbi:MAG: GC-type dockerin domain-anchored protein [Planctomycetota bacterium]
MLAALGFALVAAVTAAPASKTIVETFDRLEAGEAVEPFLVGNVTVTVDRPPTSQLRGFEFGHHPAAFLGAEGEPNPTPRFRGLSAIGFVSTVSPDDVRGFNSHQPIVFELSKPVGGFAITVLDLLTGYGNLSLTAFNARGEEVAKSDITGPLEDSGPTVRIGVASRDDDIVRVALSGGVAGSSGYGLDDLALRLASACSSADLTTSAAEEGDPSWGIADGSVDSADLIYFIAAWINSDLSIADVTTLGAHQGHELFGRRDQQVDGSDLVYFLARWLPGCS